ncbi:MAG: hypothetical protein M3347_06870, partial [Armatimonadota bacterium]|nr:hypothetical protein [Armatimonadota bacterium]
PCDSLAMTSWGLLNLMRLLCSQCLFHDLVVGDNIKMSRARFEIAWAWAWSGFEGVIVGANP